LNSEVDNALKLSNIKRFLDDEIATVKDSKANIYPYINNQTGEIIMSKSMAVNESSFIPFTQLSEIAELVGIKCSRSDFQQEQDAKRRNDAIQAREESRTTESNRNQRVMLSLRRQESEGSELSRQESFDSVDSIESDSPRNRDENPFFQFAQRQRQEDRKISSESESKLRSQVSSSSIDLNDNQNSISTHTKNLLTINLTDEAEKFVKNLSSEDIDAIKDELNSYSYPLSTQEKKSIYLVLNVIDYNPDVIDNNLQLDDFSDFLWDLL
tara:strand:+ start:1519 stop:2325 length:807 start_codon:yes stop_codon:yes gene_type:complete